MLGNGHTRFPPGSNECSHRRLSAPKRVLMIWYSFHNFITGGREVGRMRERRGKGGIDTSFRLVR